MQYWSCHFPSWLHLTLTIIGSISARLSRIISNGNFFVCAVNVCSSKAPVKVPFSSVRLAPKQAAQSLEFKEGDEVEVRS